MGESAALPLARMARDAAEEVAVQVLTFLVADDERLQRFLRVSGLDPSTARAAASSPAFMLGVLDYAAADETLLRSFATTTETHPQTVMAARSVLAPRLDEDWPPERRTGSLTIQCSYCRNTAVLPRNRRPDVPDRVPTIEVLRCGPCGGGFDQMETWLDERGNEVG